MYLIGEARQIGAADLYVRNVRTLPGAYHRLFEIEKSFRMSKHDLFAALAVSRFIEHQTGWPIREFVKTARRYRTVQIQADPTSSPPPTQSRRPPKHSPTSTMHTEVATSDH